MKRESIARSILAGAILFSQLCSSLVGNAAGNQSISGNLHCPDIRIDINFLNVTPATPAQQHVVNLTWTASKPPCFTISGFKVSGTVTFANGQTRDFESAVQGSQLGAHVPFAGIAQTTPRKVTVKVGATATAAINGSAIFPAPSPTFVTSGPCTITMHVNQASMIGLVPASERPGQDFFPKVKVEWQTPNLPACQRVSQFKVDVKLIFKGKSNKFSQTVPGTQYSTEVILKSIAVGSDFVPESIKATVTATGESRITGVALKDAAVN